MGQAFDNLFQLIIMAILKIIIIKLYNTEILSLQGIQLQ